MNEDCHHTDMCESVLDQAIAWAVALDAADADDMTRGAFEQWLQGDPLNRIAWCRLQMVEDEFARARQCRAGCRAASRRSLR